MSKRLIHSFEMKPVPQEHPLGCAVACVASLCGLSYQEALKLFEIPELAWIRGFYCSEIVQALARAELSYTFAEFDLSKISEMLRQPGTIVFVSPNSRYPSGHFLLRLENGWMNPWSNFPQMISVRADVEDALPGEVSYVVFVDTEAH
ncbi:MAG: hypothetical protein ACAH59_12535 [Pseudobdellovibrionaceae bacterium]